MTKVVALATSLATMVVFVLSARIVVAQGAHEGLLDAACREALKSISNPSHRFVKAAECGDLNAVNQSLNSGVSIATTEPHHGKTAIAVAAEYGRTEMVELLLERGAQPDAVIHTYTPLIHAAVGGHTKIVNLLLERGADANRDYAFGTPLIAAVRHRNLEVVNALVRAGADVNKRPKTPDRETALHTIAKRNDWRNSDTALIQTLLDAGADPTITDSRGMTAVQVANPEAKKLLERHLVMRRQ